MAKSEGKKFEEEWKKSYARTPYYYMRIKDAPKWIRGEKSTFTPSNDADAIQYSIPFLYLLELKSTKGTGISFNPQKPYKEPKGKNTKVMIKANQVKALMNASQKKGVIPGFIFNYRERKTKTKKLNNAVYFIHIQDFIKFAESSKKSSINRADCKRIGIEIDSQKLKINYRYNIEKFIEDSINMCIKKGYLDAHTFKAIEEFIDKYRNLYQQTAKEVIYS